MSLFNFPKSLIYISSTLCLVTISNLLLTNPANAFSVTFSNGGFDEPEPNGSLNDWTSTGDATFNTGIDGVSPLTSPSQAIVTTGYRNGIDGRSDDAGFDFNQSGIDPIDADTLIENNTASGDLQSFLNLDTNAFRIARSDSLPGYRTPKEGSAIYQDIIVNISSDDVANGTNGFNLTFNWSHLTNDGKSPDFGNQDFSFISVANNPNNNGTSGGTGDNFLNDSNYTSGSVITLGDSDGDIYDIDDDIINPSGNNDFLDQDTTHYTVGNVETVSVTGLAEGDYRYRVGFGVVDVDNYDRSSALLIDRFQVEQVPFEFSPTLGLLMMGGLMAGDRLRRRCHNKSD